MAFFKGIESGFRSSLRKPTAAEEYALSSGNISRAFFAQYSLPDQCAMLFASFSSASFKVIDS